MLFRKMLRDFRKNFGAFISVFLLSALAMTLFCTFEGHVLSQNVAREAYHKECNLSDVWVYGEGFSEEQLEKVRDLDFVQSVQLRTAITGTAPDCGGAQVDIFLENENTVNTPYYISVRSLILRIKMVSGLPMHLPRGGIFMWVIDLPWSMTE